MEYLIFLGQLVLSMVLGGILGWQRHRTGKSAGIRTFAFVSVGSTLFTLISISMQSGDPGRIAAQVLTGIGFIGAGTIIHKKDAVEGLTTAAGLWTVAAIGMAIGIGWIIQAIIASTLMLILLSIKIKR